MGRGAAAALSRRAGSVCRLLSSGTISVGDEVTVVAVDQTGG
jgi:MOSC domain-containing protein YiiM